MIDRIQKTRLIGVALIGLFLFAGLGVRLAFLHLGPNDALAARVVQVRHSELSIAAERGRILDRRGNTLAMDLEKRDVWIDPKRIHKEGHGPFIASHLSRLLEVDRDVVLERMSRIERQHEPIRRRVHKDLADQVARLRFHGVHFTAVNDRHYPQGALLCHTLGFVNMEGVGSAGVEQQFDSTLRGLPGLRVTERDGRRAEIYARRHLDIPPRPGHQIELTIDQNLQFILEQALDDGLAEFGGQAAWAAMMKVDTGEILAMASRPAFDPNQFRQSSAEERRNRVIGYNYEPGSTFKVSVIAAALNEGVITPRDLIDCENGVWHYRGRPLRDYSPHGILSVADVL